MSINRIFQWVVLLICFVGVSSCASSSNPGASGLQSGESPRIVVDLNPGWKFIRQDVADAQQRDFDDSTWASISLPHTWNNLDGEDGGNDYYQGVGWYRRHLDLSAAPLTGKSLFIHFDAASIACDVFINGKSAGPTHKGMFGAFCYDVTSLLNPAGDNVIAVRVNNAHDKDVPPLSADFTFYGGIYRGVRLLALDPLSISPLDDASSGVYVRQTDVTPDAAALQITTKLRNGASSDALATVTTEVLDAGNKPVWTISSQTNVPAGATADSVQKITGDHPHLWNGRKDAYLYHVRVTVAGNAGVCDRVEQPLGIRFFRVDPDRGFILNGRPYPLHGVNRHQDRQDKGWAISLSDHQEDFDLIMEMGCTAIRLAHYEHAQEFYDLCDAGGLVVWAEDGLVNEVNPEPAFDESAKQQLRELIKQNYNHPSICFWSLYNELRDSAGVSADQLKLQQQHQIDLVTQLNSLAHELDPTRPTTAATLRPAEYLALNQITDILAFNEYWGWYRGKISDWPGNLDRLRAVQPGRALAISEYGAGASIFEHEYTPSQPITTGVWHPEEWQNIVHEQSYAAMKDRPWLWATFLWNMFDFGSDRRTEGDHLGINDKGLVTYDRKIKKDAFYFYKTNWTTEPFVYLTDRRFNPRNIATGPVKIYSNCDSVELKLNGKSLGSQAGANHVFVWQDVTLDRGANDLQAVGFSGGKQVTDTCAITFDPGSRPMRPMEPATKPITRP